MDNDLITGDKLINITLDYKSMKEIINELSFRVDDVSKKISETVSEKQIDSVRERIEKMQERLDQFSGLESATVSSSHSFHGVTQESIDSNVEDLRKFFIQEIERNRQENRFYFQQKIVESINDFSNGLKTELNQFAQLKDTEDIYKQISEMREKIQKQSEKPEIQYVAPEQPQIEIPRYSPRFVKYDAQIDSLNSKLPPIEEELAKIVPSIERNQISINSAMDQIRELKQQLTKTYTSMEKSSTETSLRIGSIEKQIFDLSSQQNYISEQVLQQKSLIDLIAKAPAPAPTVINNISGEKIDTEELVNHVILKVSSSFMQQFDRINESQKSLQQTMNQEINEIRQKVNQISNQISEYENRPIATFSIGELHEIHISNIETAPVSQPPVVVSPAPVETTVIVKEQVIPTEVSQNISKIEESITLLNKKLVDVEESIKPLQQLPRSILAQSDRINGISGEVTRQLLPKIEMVSSDINNTTDRVYALEKRVSGLESITIQNSSNGSPMNHVPSFEVLAPPLMQSISTQATLLNEMQIQVVQFEDSLTSPAILTPVNRRSTTSLPEINPPKADIKEEVIEKIPEPKPTNVNPIYRDPQDLFLSSPLINEVGSPVPKSPNISPHERTKSTMFSQTYEDLEIATKKLGEICEKLRFDVNEINSKQSQTSHSLSILNTNISQLISSDQSLKLFDEHLEKEVRDLGKMLIQLDKKEPIQQQIINQTHVVQNNTPQPIIHEIEKKVEGITEFLPNLVTRTDLNEILSSIATPSVGPSDGGMTAIGRIGYRCLLCGKPASTSGMIMESEVARMLGTPPQTTVGKSDGKFVLVYGKDSLRNSNKSKKLPSLAPVTHPSH